MVRGVGGEIFGYALIVEKGEALQRFVNMWVEVLTATGMKVSKEKTEVMMLSREREKLNIRIRDRALKKTDNF